MATNAPEINNLRHLGSLEKFSSVRHSLGYFNNVAITATYHLSSSMSPFPKSSTFPLGLKSLILTALTSLLNHHSILSCVVLDEDTESPYFARLPSIDVERVVRYVVRAGPIKREGEFDEELDQLLSEEHSLGFKSEDGKVPFWRMVISIESGRPEVFTASFFFHHSLADGISALTFAKDFHTGLNAIEGHTGDTDRLFVPSKDGRISESLEFLSSLSLPPIRNLPSGKVLWVGENPIPSAPTDSSSKFRSLTVSASTTASIIRACKANGTTIGAAIPIIIASAVAKCIPDEYDELECTIPINLRPFLPTTQRDNVGVYYDGFSHYIPISSVKSFTWKAVRNVSASIKSHIEGVKTGRINTLSFSNIPSIKDMFLARLNLPRTSTYDVSNIGTLSKVNESRKEGAWKMGRCVFSRSAFITGSAFTLGVVTGGDGCMVLGFAWQEEAVSQQMIQRIIEGVRELVTQIAVSE